MIINRSIAMRTLLNQLSVRSACPIALQCDCIVNRLKGSP